MPYLRASSSAGYIPTYCIFCYSLSEWHLDVMVAMGDKTMLMLGWTCICQRYIVWLANIVNTAISGEH